MNNGLSVEKLVCHTLDLDLDLPQNKTVICHENFMREFKFQFKENVLRLFKQYDRF